MEHYFLEDKEPWKCILRVSVLIPFKFTHRYLKYRKRCLNERKKLGSGCSEVNFMLIFFRLFFSHHALQKKPAITVTYGITLLILLR